MAMSLGARDVYPRSQQKNLLLMAKTNGDIIGRNRGVPTQLTPQKHVLLIASLARMRDSPMRPACRKTQNHNP